MTDLANQIDILSAAATPGEWFYGIAYEPKRGPVGFDYRSPGYYDNTGIMAKDTTIAGCGEYHIFDNLADVDLMITLRNAVPQIIAALRAADEADALRARVAELESVVRLYMASTDEHDTICPVGPIYSCNCGLHLANQAARKALGAKP